MIRTGYLLISLFLVTMLHSCQRQHPLVIEPISEESNVNFLSEKNLDPSFYSTKIVFQYYQVSGYDHLPAKDIALKLDSFVKLRYPIKENKHRKSVTIGSTRSIGSAIMKILFMNQPGKMKWKSNRSYGRCFGFDRLGITSKR
jgi:hypothetical protein